MLVAGTVLAVALAGCGGSSGGSNADTRTSTTASGGPGGFQLTDDQRSCIEDKGVTVPQGAGQPPSGGSPPQAPPSGRPPGGQDFQKLQQALQDCGVNLPNPPQGGGNFDPSAMRKQISAYVACVRKNGFDMPKPDTSGNGPVFDSSQVNQNDPKFKAASAKCQNLLPASPQGVPSQGQ
ncbi:MAG: hypothetical protein ACXWEL_00440 [Solirubrobacterales bacterium]